MILKTKLQKMRVNTGMTQQELAIKANMNIVTLQKLETGVNKINGARAETVFKLAHALGTTVEDLLTDEKENN